MLIVMNKSTYEKKLFQPLQTKKNKSKSLSAS